MKIQIQRSIIHLLCAEAARQGDYMKKVKKRISLLLAIITLISVFSASVSAAVADPVKPRWKNTGVVSCLIGFPDDGYGYAEGHVMGHPTVNKITADVYVYRQSGDDWIYAGEEHKTVYSASLNISCKFEPIDGAYYKADYTFVVTKNGVDELITGSVKNFL